MKISDDDVRHVAKLARLDLAEGEVQSLGADLNRILDYVDKLNELDTDAVEPTSHVVNIPSPFREDDLSCESRPEDAVANAPRRDGHFFVVPSIIE